MANGQAGEHNTQETPMNRIRSDGRFACPLAELALTGPNLLRQVRGLDGKIRDAG